MSEFRRDPITGRWCIIAEGRSVRPNEYAASPARVSEEECPFCEGHESRTPPEVAAVRPNRDPANGPGWTVRSIPNKFPTVASGAVRGPPERSSLFRSAAGAGFHEVVIESPTHAPPLPLLEPTHLRVLFRFFRERVRALAGRPSIASVLLFENQGPESGGTLTHPHAQLVATETIPLRLAEESAGFRRESRGGAGGCLLESLVVAESQAQRRIVRDDETFTVLAPYASEHPYETWIVPRRHSATFATASDGEVDRLAELLPRVLRALDRVRPNASYNWCVHEWDAPPAEGSAFHWHIELAPRLVRADGYELGAGIPVNPVSPERAAAELRAQLEPEPTPSPQKR